MSNQVMSKQKRIGTQQRNKITPTHSHLVNAKQISKKKVKQKNLNSYTQALIEKIYKRRGKTMQKQHLKLSKM